MSIIHCLIAMKVRMEKTGEEKTGQMSRNDKPMADVEVQLYLLQLRRGYSKWPLHFVFFSLNLNKIHSIPNVNVYDHEDYVILFSFLRLYLYEFRGALICSDLLIKKNLYYLVMAMPCRQEVQKLVLTTCTSSAVVTRHCSY